MEKVTETMWCWHCEHEWITDDYYGTMKDQKCPNCVLKPIQIMRTSSTGYAYAHLSKHPEMYAPSLTGKVCIGCDWPDCKSNSCIHLKK